jgi:hypothetical protein
VTVLNPLYNPPNHLAALANKLFEMLCDLEPKLSQVCGSMPDEELADFVADEQQYKAFTKLSKHFLIEMFPHYASLDRIPRWLWPLWSVLRRTLRITLLGEGMKRMSKRNHHFGWAVIKFLQAKKGDVQLRQCRAIANNLWHPEWSKRDGIEDVVSDVAALVVEKTRKVLVSEDAYRDHILAAIKGRYQRIGENTHRAISDSLVRDYKHLKNRTFVVYPSLLSFPEEKYGNEYMERRVLVEEYMNHPLLDNKEKLLIEMHYRGHTQKEIAEELHDSQAAISQRLSKITSKLSSLTTK